jgi:hypothetical protein
VQLTEQDVSTHPAPHTPAHTRAHTVSKGNAV